MRTSVNHSEVIKAMQNLSAWRFVLIWIWMIVATGGPLVSCSVLAYQYLKPG